MNYLHRWALAGAVLVFACSTVRAAEPPSPALAKIIEAAKKEPKLNLEWGGGILGGGDALKVIAGAMNANLRH